MKHAIPVILLGFGVALAIVIGQRMSTDAMAVVIGVAVGVAASVPVSLLLVALLRKERASYHDQGRRDFDPYPPQLPNQQPNIIMLDPSMFQRGRGDFQMPLPPPQAESGLRRIHVIGED